ncbi:2'-5' RNA ligase family protein [Streptomyces lonegramiae]|uniref:2'-5' RNA ligase family protein n=1 Tax=Streptomyces lonegramiae TaxID=3075524 RepID=A0ABU2XP55_9ACTN|nr:2'-5' RNA ligase family protein [Streptomyces sp. DSM 41529]MDT0547696.1 2'-5' RNA ligase family protein [Streptomyces sp. DSM 41529]
MALLNADSAAFPTEPPADLRDPVAIAAHDWAAFSALEEMTDHWTRPDWSDGSRAYYWLLTFSDSPRLAELARRCQTALAPLGLDAVPIDGLHITLSGIGAPDAITPRQLDALASRAGRAALVDAFSIQAVPLTGSRGAVRLSVGPWEPLVRLQAALVQLGTDAGIAPKKSSAAFRPHLSLAYNNRRRPAMPAIEAVASLRSLAAVDLDITHVQLVELRRSGTQYHWDVLTSLPLTVPRDLMSRPAG